MDSYTYTYMQDTSNGIDRIVEELSKANKLKALELDLIISNHIGKEWVDKHKKELEDIMNG